MQITATDSAVLYLRVSTDEQVRHGVSLEAQEERLRAYCTMRGFHVVAVIRDEGVSAYKHLHTRPGGAQLLSLIEAGKARHVVAYKLDRLFRNAADALTLTEHWNAAGVALHLVDMGGAAIDTAGSTGRMMLTMLAGFAEFERALISERTMVALAHKKKHLQAYGPTPYGYTRSDGLLEAHTDELATVAQVQEWSQDGLSLRAICQRLNDAGTTTRRGGRWYPESVRYLLRNDLYDADVLPV
jgi:DNA invertase Pin-like site-specific DNA recombinase